MKIWIDAGHGGSASGAVNGDRMEKDDTLRLAKRVEAAVSRCGMTPIMTRREDVYVSLRERTALENREGCALAISLHRNAAGASAKGMEVWLHHLAPKSYEEWAELVLSELEAVGMTRNRGIKRGYRGDPQADYAINRETNAPSMLLELGFITNEEDNRLYDEHLEEYAEAIVKASCQWLGKEYIPPDGSGQTLYRVQVGAFKERENAAALRDELKEAGYPAWITE